MDLDQERRDADDEREPRGKPRVMGGFWRRIADAVQGGAGEARDICKAMGLPPQRLGSVVDGVERMARVRLLKWEEGRIVLTDKARAQMKAPG